MVKLKWAGLSYLNAHIGMLVISMYCKTCFFHVFVARRTLLVRWFIIGGRAWPSMHCWSNVLSWHTNHG